MNACAKCGRELDYDQVPFCKRCRAHELTAAGIVGRVACQECGDDHIAEYSHEGQFGEGPVFAVVCPVDQLTDYYTLDAVTVTP